MQCVVNQCLMGVVAFCGFFCVFVKSVLSLVSGSPEFLCPLNKIRHIGYIFNPVFIIFDILQFHRLNINDDWVSFLLNVILMLLLWSKTKYPHTNLSFWGRK